MGFGLRRLARWAQVGPSWGQVAILSRLGGILKHLGGNMDDKITKKRQLGGNLSHLKAILSRKGAKTHPGGRRPGGMREAVFTP